MCYLGHQKFLLTNHPFQKYKKSFDDKEKHMRSPTPLQGVELLEELNEFNNVFVKGKRKRLRDNKGPWKKDLYSLNYNIGHIKIKAQSSYDARREENM